MTGRTRAEKAATGVPNVAQVVNNLQVKNQKASSSQLELPEWGGEFVFEGSETRAFELPVPFVRMHGYAIFSKPKIERTTSGGLNWFREPEKRVREFVSIFEPL